MRPLLLFLLALSTASADWPTYLHNASRVGATTDEMQLQLPLQLAWTFESASAPQMDWAGEDGRVFESHETLNRIRFDGANANSHHWEQFLRGEFKRRRLVFSAWSSLYLVAERHHHRRPEY